MKILPDSRRIRIHMVNMVDGKSTLETGADAWQEQDGFLVVSGLWGDLFPMSEEDHMLKAEQMGISSLEWLIRRLATCPAVTLEIFD